MGEPHDGPFIRWPLICATIIGLVARGVVVFA
jgi:hypothetical protein